LRSSRPILVGGKSIGSSIGFEALAPRRQNGFGHDPALLMPFAAPSGFRGRRLRLGHFFALSLSRAARFLRWSMTVAASLSRFRDYRCEFCKCGLAAALAMKFC
jgi:hypothetical protein